MQGGGSLIRKFVMCSAKEGVARELHAQDKPHPCPSPFGKGRGAIGLVLVPTFIDMMTLRRLFANSQIRDLFHERRS